MKRRDLVEAIERIDGIALEARKQLDAGNRDMAATLIDAARAEAAPVLEWWASDE